VRRRLRVGSASALFGTTYGLTLLAKIGLVLVLVAFAALNHYRFVPRLDRDRGAARSFLSDSRAELAVMAFVLVATAVLTGLAPAKSATTTASAGLPSQALAAAKAHVGGTSGWTSGAVVTGVAPDPRAEAPPQ
jgi:copper transport protein